MKYIYEDYVNAPTPDSHAVTKRKMMLTRTEEEQQQTPEQPEAGWSPTRPDSPDLFIAGVKLVRQQDGSFTKLFKVMVKPEIIAAKKRKAKNLLRRIKREDREANAKLSKLRVRALLVVLRP